MGKSPFLQAFSWPSHWSLFFYVARWWLLSCAALCWWTQREMSGRPPGWLGDHWGSIGKPLRCIIYGYHWGSMTSLLPDISVIIGFVWKCWVNIPNEIAIFHRDNDQQSIGFRGLAYFQTHPCMIYYPLVNIQKAIENGHRNSGLSH